MTIQTHEEYLTAYHRFHDLNTGSGPFKEIEGEMNALAAAMAEYMQSIGVEPAFEIDSEERLEWYVGKIADAESRKKRIQAQADAMIADEDRIIKGLEWRFGAQAEAMTRRLLEGRRGKSVKFLGGTIGLRKTPGRVKFDGNENVLPLEIHEQVIGTKVDTTALNRLIKVVGDRAYDVNTGQELNLPGLSVTPEGEKLYVKAGKEE